MKNENTEPSKLGIIGFFVLSGSLSAVFDGILFIHSHITGGKFDGWKVSIYSFVLTCCLCYLLPVYAGPKERTDEYYEN